jgi:DNA-binding NtrC family response regulator
MANLAKLNLLPATLICDRDTFFCEELRNFLLAAGYLRVDVAVTARKALARIHQGRYGYVLIGLSHPFSLAWRLAAVAHLRNSRAVIVFIMNGEDQPLVRGPALHYVIKEHAFATLLGLI